MKSYNESDSENDSKGYIDNEEKSKYNGNDNEDEGKDNNGNDNDNSKSENNVYWCFDEASEYKGWVIKLDLTTPVKF